MKRDAIVEHDGEASLCGDMRFNRGAAGPLRTFSVNCIVLISVPYFSYRYAADHLKEKQYEKYLQVHSTSRM